MSDCGHSQVTPEPCDQTLGVRQRDELLRDLSGGDALGQVLQEARPGWRADASPGVQNALENVGVGS